jgi:hypothetical protein
VVPTWRNGRSGQEAIARRLDRCMVSEGLLAAVGLSRSWVEYPFISDHAPILLQLEIPPIYKAYPFKLNANWLQDKDYVALVHKVWKDPRFLTEGDKQCRLVWKLKELKCQTKIWVKEVKARDKALLENLEAEIKDNLMKFHWGFHKSEEEHLLRELECKRNKILREEEESWRLRSRATWIKSGDNNTRFFHKVASHNRNQKHVWEIMDGNGIILTDQGAIRAEAVTTISIFLRPSQTII